jgi:hypothetical protein
MANDEREEEREFLAGLKARTGRDLGEWMAAIAAKGFHDKNEIIDWLRAEGLPFARASWLERIHRNGGKPIHAEPPVGSDPALMGSDPAGLAPGHAPGHSGPIAVPPSKAPALRLVRVVPTPASPPPPVPAAPTPAADPSGHAMGSDPQGLTPSTADPAPAPAAAASKPARKAPKPPPRIEPPADPAALEKLVAAAKGYRPLYHHLEAQIRRAIPDAVIAARDRYVAIGGPLEFAAVTLHPTEIRLGLALGDRPFDETVQPAKLRGPGAGITHMVVLTDARQVGDELLSLLKAANAGINA